jgi:hypothetical protein
MRAIVWEFQWGIEFLTIFTFLGILAQSVALRMFRIKRPPQNEDYLDIEVKFVLIKILFNVSKIKLKFI